MENGKISLRQCKRLLFFDIISLGLLFLPDALAGWAGTNGVIAIFIGMLLAVCYVGLLCVWMKKNEWSGGTMESGAESASPVTKALFGLYGIYFLLLGGYSVFLLADMTRTFLLSEEAFWLIAFLLILLAMYSRKTGLEGRGRAFEVLFWPTVALLVLLFVLGLGELRFTNIFPIGIHWQGLGSGVGISFFVCSVVQMVFFLPDALEDGVSWSRLCRGVQRIVLLAGVFLLFLYEMLLGSFGTPALADAKIPVMIFASNMVLPGGFLRRQEALVAGVCFLGILALTGSCIQYSQTCFGRVKKSRSHVWLVSGFVFLLCLWENYHARDALELGTLLLWLTPAAMALPFILPLTMRKRKKEVPKEMPVKKPGRRCSVFLAFLLLVCCTCTGCSLEELEDKSFPMAILLGEEDGFCTLNYKYMDLSRVSEKEKTNLGSDELQVRGATLLEAMNQMNAKNGKSMDLNHAKVLLLERSFLEDDRLLEQLMKEGNQGAMLSGNLLVLATDDVKQVAGLQEGMDEDLGSYLEKLVQGNPSYKNALRFALKSWTCDWYQGNYLSALPKVTVSNDLPVVDGYLGYFNDKITGEGQVHELSLEEGLCIGLCEGAIKRLDLSVGQGTARLERLMVSYEFSRSNSRVLCHVTITGDLDREKSVNAPQEAEIEEYVCSIIRNAWKDRKLDLTNSYTHLCCHDRDIYRAYEGDFPGYCDDLQLEVDADFGEY